MATKEIELMPAEVRAEKRKRETKRLAILVSIAFLIISASLTATVLAFYTVLLTEVNLTKRAVDAEEKKITSFEETENLAERVYRKAMAIEGVFKSRDNYSILFEVLAEILPQDVTISNLSVTKNTISVSGTAKSYVAVAKFLLIVVEPEKGGKLFEKADLTSVSLDSKSGEARFAARLDLKMDILQQ